MVSSQDLRLESDNPGLGDALLPMKISCEVAIEIGLGCELEMHHCHGSCYGNTGYYCKESDEHCHYGVAMDLRVENDNQVLNRSVDLSVWSECKASRKMTENLVQVQNVAGPHQCDDLKMQIVDRKSTRLNSSHVD